ncbi:MAG: hydrogenase, partial [Rhodothermales bacterium]|nr:hydrogenase [Rhodothermales bacterium]
MTASSDVLPGHSGDGHVEEPPLVAGNMSFHDVTELVAYHTEKKTPTAWLAAFALANVGLLLLGVMVAYLVWNGTGVWGLNNPVGWGYAIVNFVFWVGIGHAGTLISAILDLFRQQWRTAINRSAEAMTIFAVICALVFAGFHVGLIWLAYWMLPFPNQMEMCPEFKIPLLWDVF